LFDYGLELIGRHEIIGDLARFRQEFIGSASKAEGQLAQLEVLAAAAVDLGMSYKIVGKASGIPQERIDAVLHAQPSGVRRQAADYERHSSGVITLREC
jgi:hypothetical protein